MAGYRKEFTTTAARLAYTVLDSDLGHSCKDYENGSVYMFMAEGAGAAKMRRIAVASTIPDSIVIDLQDFREVTSGGDPGNDAANGGVLSSETTPILLGDAAESLEIQWATGNSDIVSVSIALPYGFDGTRDVSIELTGYGGTTNAPSYTVETGWDGGTLVADTAAGTAAAGSQHFAATVAAADVPDAPRRLTLMLTPGTHASDAFGLTAVRVRHFVA